MPVELAPLRKGMTMMVTFLGGPLHAQVINVQPMPAGDSDPDRVGHLKGCVLPPLHPLESCHGELPPTYVDVRTAERYTGVYAQHSQTGPAGTVLEGQPIAAWKLPIYLHVEVPPQHLNALLPVALAHRAFMEWGERIPLDHNHAADAAVIRGEIVTSKDERNLKQAQARLKQATTEEQRLQIGRELAEATEAVNREVAQRTAQRPPASNPDGTLRNS